ncbi:MAG TPA: choice-of-anchor D domain-containing protein, partial [Solirubrobacteraceae bacterium]|nr:choice-of-anchor D domain-containing protein [Solirubrobacteraceae bacterium]
DIGTPQITVTGPSFPLTTVGLSSVGNLTLTPHRDAKIASVSSSDPQFKVGHPSVGPNSTVSAGQSVTVPITYTPVLPGHSGAILTVKASQQTATTEVSGDGAAAVLTASASQLHFGSAPVGTPLSKPVSFTNTGPAALKIDSVHLPTAPFSVSGALTAGAILQPGQSLAVNVTFDPLTAGSFAESLKATAEGSEANVELLADATPAAPIALVETPPPTLVPIPPLATPPVGLQPARLSGLRVSPRTIARIGRSRRRVLIAYDLTAGATVKITVERRVVGRHCAHHRSCVRFVPTKIVLTIAGKPGANHSSLSVASLRPGSYRLSVTATAPTGLSQTTSHMSFKITL